MLTNKVLHDAGVYTNLQGLGSLNHEYTNNSRAVKKEVSQQFESMLIQMLLKSMRDTNSEFMSGLTDNDQSAMYNDMFDKQLSLVLSKSGLGIAKTIEDYMDKNGPEDTMAISTDPKAMTALHNHFLPAQSNKPIKPQFTDAIDATVSDPQEQVSVFSDASDFVSSLWGAAKEAAKNIGVDPKILLAQAALETGWGKKIIPHAGGASSNNLFNIKADKQWTNETTRFDTLEEKDGLLVKEKSTFKVYDSFQASFKDYTHFLQQNSRYSDALKNAHDPQKYLNSLQQASYATDKLYSEKIMDIYSSKKFNRLFDNLI